MDCGLICVVLFSEVDLLRVPLVDLLSVTNVNTLLLTCCVTFVGLLCHFSCRGMETLNGSVIVRGLDTYYWAADSKTQLPRMRGYWSCSSQSKTRLKVVVT